MSSIELSDLLKVREAMDVARRLAHQPDSPLRDKAFSELAYQTGVLDYYIGKATDGIKVEVAA